MTGLPDTARVAAIIRDVAVTVVLPHFRTLAPGDISEKTGPLDLVTIADVASEKALSARLAELVPGSLIVGEEAVSADPALLDRLDGDAPVWVIDPIDGTFNFASGNPLFGMIVAYVHKGRTLAGWIHDPVRDRTAIGVAGQGVTVDGQAARLAPLPADFKDAAGVLSRRYCPVEWAARIEAKAAAFAKAPQSVCSAQEYFALLTGEAQFSYYNKVMPWDHAAGSMMVAEAGGVASFLDGTAYQPGERRANLLVASSRAGWDRIDAFVFR